MILLLDTSTSLCRVSFIDGDKTVHQSWQADRELAKGLLRYLDELLKDNGYSWTDIKGIGVFQGPGSFTGLRIGLTVMNTLADAEQIPIVGKRGDDWQHQAIESLESGENDTLVMPFYGSEAHITKPRK